MALREQIGGTDDERVYIGTDWTKSWKVADYDTDSTGATAKNVAAFAMSFDIRPFKWSADDLAWFTKTVGSGLAVSGVFNSVLATSTQQVTVTIADTDITTANAGIKGGRFYYSLKRTDPGFESILAEGTIVIERATQV